MATNRQLTKNKVTDYLKSLTEKNVDLKKFIGSAPSEIDDVVDSNDGLSGAALNFYGYRWKLSGNAQRTFNTRTISFAILIDGVDPENYAAQEDAITSAEAMGLELISRIYQDSQRQDIAWLYNNIDKDAIIAEEIRGEKTEGLYGMDFHMDIKVSEPLTVDKEKWSDGDIFCG